MGGVVIKLTLGFRSVLPTRRMKRRALLLCLNPSCLSPFLSTTRPSPLSWKRWREGRGQPVTIRLKDTAVGP